MVDQPGALATQLMVDRPQRSFQLASGLAFEGRQERAQALESGPGILGLAVPGSPAQPLNFGDDRRFRMLLIGDPRQARMVRRPEQPSANTVSAVSRAQPRASSVRRIGAAMSVPAFATAPNTCRSPPGHLSVADAHLQVPLAVVAAADKGRVQAEGDRRCWRCRHCRQLRVPQWRRHGATARRVRSCDHAGSCGSSQPRPAAGGPACRRRCGRSSARTGAPAVDPTPGWSGSASTSWFLLRSDRNLGRVAG